MDLKQPDHLPASAVAPATRDFWPEARELIEADGTGRGEIALRWGIVLAGGAVLWRVTGSSVFPAWSVTYIAIHAIYLRLLLSNAPPVPAGAFRGLLGLNFLSSLSYAAMPVYLMLQDGAGLRFIGVCGFLGMCLHNLVRHRGLRLVAAWDAMLMSAGAALAGWAFIGTATSAGEAALILTGTGALTGYFLVSYLGNLRLRDRLASAETLSAEARKMEAVGRLTGGVAHDFNNILTVILGNLDLYDELQTDAERDGVVTEARLAASRAATLTAQLLSYSRRAPLLPEVITVGDYLRGFRAMCDRLLPETVSVICDTGRPGLTVHADPNQLTTALLNLVINARDAMPEGGCITITAAPRDLGPGKAAGAGAARPLSGAFTAITVRDQGPGIAPEMMADVLTPFFTTKPVGKGSGLGLSMVLGFAEQTRGALTLRNRDDGGLEAELLLPRAPR